MVHGTYVQWPMHIVSHSNLTFILLALETQWSVTNKGVTETETDFRELAGDSVEHKLDVKSRKARVIRKVMQQTIWQMGPELLQKHDDGEDREPEQQSPARSDPATDIKNSLLFHCLLFLDGQCLHTSNVQFKCLLMTETFYNSPSFLLFWPSKFITHISIFIPLHITHYCI